MKSIKILVAFIVLLLFIYFSPISASASDSGYNGSVPLFVTISTDWCFACKILDPVVEELKKEYDGQIEFVRLDATNEDTVKSAQSLAYRYGVLEFFNANRNAFPRVAIYCPHGLSPNKNLLGAFKQDFYKVILDEMLNRTDEICSIGGSLPLPKPEPENPPAGSPENTEVTGRPVEAEFLDRPKEIVSSGRPEELKFWTYGQSIPLYAYYRSWVLPKCSGGNQVLCYNGSPQQAGRDNDQDSNLPAFKPWTPNATRDEKGLHL